MGGEQPYGVAADALLGQRAAGQVLRLELVEQRDHALAAVGAGGRREQLGAAALHLRDVVEQRDDGVEVAVGRPGGRTEPARRRLELVAASGCASTAPTARPPDRLRRAARGPRSSSWDEPRRGAGDAAVEGDQRAGGRRPPPAAARPTAWPAGSGRRAGSAGRARAAPGPSRLQRRGVGATERGEQQLAGGLRGEDAGVGDHAQRHQQRRDGRFLGDRQLVAGDLERVRREALRTLRSKGMLRAPDRTSTAIRDHGVPSSRCSRRSSSAIASASAPTDGWVCASTAPACFDGPGWSVAVGLQVLRPAGRVPGWSGRSAGRPRAAALPERRQTRQRLHRGVCLRLSCGSRSGTRAGPLTSAPRKP